MLRSSTNITSGIKPAIGGIQESCMVLEQAQMRMGYKNLLRYVFLITPIPWEASISARIFTVISESFYPTMLIMAGKKVLADHFNTKQITKCNT